MQPLAPGAATHKFARRFFGLDAIAVYRFLGEIAGALDRVQDEARAAVKAANVQAAAAAQEAAKLEARIRSCQEREASIAQTLVLAQAARREIEARAQADAEKSVAAAQRDADEIVKSSREAAAEIADEAHRLAKQALEGARRLAEAQLALARVESGLLIEESSAVAGRIGLLTRQQTAAMSAEVAAIVAEHSAPTAQRQRPAGLDELSFELARAIERIVALEAEILPGAPQPKREEGHQHDYGRAGHA